MKKLFLITLVLALFGFSADAKPKGPLGTWHSDCLAIVEDGEVIVTLGCAEFDIDMTFTFKRNGTVDGIMVSEGETKESSAMKWRMENGEVVVWNGDTSIPFMYEDGRLWLETNEDGILIRVMFEKHK